MNQPNLRGVLEKFAEKYALRFVESEKRFLGLHRGLHIDAWEHKGTLWFYFFSPTVRLGDAVVDNFKGFSNVMQSAIPLDWLERRWVGEIVDTQGCLLKIDEDRLTTIAEMDLLGFPEILTLDFCLVTRNCG